MQPIQRVRASTSAGAGIFGGAASANAFRAPTIIPSVSPPQPPPPPPPPPSAHLRANPISSLSLLHDKSRVATQYGSAGSQAGTARAATATAAAPPPSLKLPVTKRVTLRFALADAHRDRLAPVAAALRASGFEQCVAWPANCSGHIVTWASDTDQHMLRVFVLLESDIFLEFERKAYIEEIQNRGQATAQAPHLLLFLPERAQSHGLTMFSRHLWEFLASPTRGVASAALPVSICMTFRAAADAISALQAANAKSAELRTTYGPTFNQLNELVSHQSTALQLLTTLPIDAAGTENGEGGPSSEELKSQACSLLLDSFGSIQRVAFATPAQILQRTPLSRACAAEIGAFFDKDA